jgi:predicted regulator of Ras-like GTPase activity (Roadblock/LC7/MglB family)
LCVSKLQDKLAELVATTTGAEGAALIDIGTGMTLAQAGTPGFDLDVAAQGFATAVRYQLRTISDLGLTDLAEGMLISQGSHHHIFGVRTSDNREGLIVYLAVRRDGATLSAARRRVAMMASRLPA